jgi:serine kinase of HPr protein (carbohydrate metabolism regulator)
MAEARREGHLAALLSDDQVFLEAVNGHVIATAPASIKGMIELYGSGIGHVKTIDEMVLDFAIQPVSADSSNRIPEENQRWNPTQDISLPFYRMDRAATDPFAWLAVLLAGFPVSGSFQL